MNLETIIDTQSWYKIWQLNGSSRIRAKQKLLRKHKGACKSSWSRIGSLKSFTLTIPWNLSKSVKIFPGIIVRYCCNQVWTKNGGRILWSVTALCETFKTTCLMGKHLTNSGSANQLKANNYIWFYGRISPYLCQVPVETPPVR